ncbi:MAG: ABC transporter ATP-binding protein [Leptolyngbya sp. SIO4C1]|nr:ABC transporter ATP-binding protein [Leptolyngbya sp. SIO4C1]
MIRYLSKVLYVLPGKKSQLIVLLLILVATSFLEAIGIGLIGPFIKIASAPESVHDIALLERLYRSLDLESSSQFIPILGLIVGTIFFTKSIAYFLARSYIYHFSFRQKELLISRLLNAYLSVPYTFHLKRNTSSLIKNIVVEVNQFTQNCVLQLLNTASNIIITAALVLLLAKTSALLLTLILGALLPIIVFLKVFRGKFKRWGKHKSQSNQEMIRVLNHSLGSIKETRLIGCEPYFSAQMDQQSKRFSRSSTLFASSQLMPRILIESLLVLFIIAFVSLYQLFSQQSIEDLTAILSVFAVTALRLIPSTSQFVQGIGYVQNSSYTLDMLYNDLKELEKVDAEYLPASLAAASGKQVLPQQSKRHFEFDREIRLADIQYRYPGTLDNALNNISLTIQKGELVALIGKSGAGKTTLVDIILGLLTPTHGDILVDGTSIYSSLRGWQNIVGYIPQSIFLIDDTIERNIAFGVPDRLIDQPRLAQAIRAAQLEALIEQLPDGVATSVGERGVRLSGGQRQRIGIARALYHEREILVLDEATSALDSETEKQISEAINALAGSKTLIIIAHRLSTVRNCDRLYMLQNGEVVKAGSYQEVVS